MKSIWLSEDGSKVLFMFVVVPLLEIEIELIADVISKNDKEYAVCFHLT